MCIRDSFVTLLTPADDPNTFELVARNLKMKARGNQKSNEGNQIERSPHDTENHKKIVQNQPKIDIEPWTGLGGSWGRLGSHLGSQGCLAQKKGARWPKNDRVWAPILGSIFDIFRYVSMFFCVLFLVSILMANRFFMDFEQFVGSFLEAFFISFRIVGK